MVISGITQADDFWNSSRRKGWEEEFWYGGRDGYQVYEDEWASSRSWSYSKVVQRSREYSLHAYLKLRIEGTRKGRCVPQRAVAHLAFGQDRDDYSKGRVELGKLTTRSLKEAKKWAEGLATQAAIKVLYQEFYSSFALSYQKKGMLIEKFDPVIGWHEWLWAFDLYHKDLPHGVYRTTDSNQRTQLVKVDYGWSTSSWPSAWDRIVREPHWAAKGHDEYGPL